MFHPANGGGHRLSQPAILRINRRISCAQFIAHALGILLVSHRPKPNIEVEELTLPPLLRLTSI